MDWNKLLPNMENIRSVVRPVLTLTGWLVLLYLALTTEAVRDFFLGSIATMIGFWFGQRK